jgi:hypothetical protein
MEEKPPAQRRSRSPQSPFNAPEQPAQRAARRPAKAAPAVTFQPPEDDNPSSGTGTASPPATPGRPSIPGPRATTAAKRTRRTPAQPPTEVGEQLIPEQPQPADKPVKKATPAKRAPRKAPAPRATKTPPPPAAEPPVSSKPAPSGSAADKAADKIDEPPAAAPGQPEAVESVPSSVPTPPPALPDRPSVDVPVSRTEAWAKIVADPGHSPELLALAAVQTIGPRAREWASRISSAYPTASAAGRARLAARQFTRFGVLSSVFAAQAGSYAPVALLGTTALTHADLVLHIAAAHGFDPMDEQRAVDLLVLTKVHPTRDDALAALRTAKQPAYEEEDGGFTDAAWRLGRLFAAQAGSWAVVRVVNRLLPGTSLLTAVLASRSSAQALSARAHRYYSQESQAAGSSV